jgi:hypothetical protein
VDVVQRLDRFLWRRCHLRTGGLVVRAGSYLRFQGGLVLKVRRRAHM